MLLENLAIKYGTDKQIKNGHGYTKIYSELFDDIRLQKLNFLELGVREGWSINMWAEYLPNSNIYCIDNNFENKCPEKFDNPNIHFSICSQDDDVELSKICNNVDGFDIIIDDCSHISPLSIKSFEILFKYVKTGGYYIIEDVHVCNLPEYKPYGPNVKDYIKTKNISNVKITDKLIIIKK